MSVADLQMKPSNVMNRKFIKFIAYMQVISIVLVVFGHSFHEYPDGQHGVSLLMYRMMFSFRMPTFMFVSGFLMAYTSLFCTNKNVTFWRFVKSKVRRLLLPYILLTLVTFVPRAALSEIADDSIELSWYGLYRGLFYMDSMPVPLFWFIQASFLLLILCFALVVFSRKIGMGSDIPIIVLIALSIFLPLTEIREIAFFSIGLAVGLSLFFSLGILYARFFREIDSFVNWSSWLVFIMFVALWACLFFITGTTRLFPLCQLVGICMIISLSRILESCNLNWLDKLIGANYMIFLLSWYFNVLAQQFLAHYVEWPWYVHTVLSLVLGIYAPYKLYKYMKANASKTWVRSIAYMLGQNLQSTHK